MAVDHVYTTMGAYTVLVTARDKDGATGPVSSQLLTVQSVQMQGNTLAVGGTLSNDIITLSPADTVGDINVNLNCVSQGNFNPTDHILVYGQSGNDRIRLVSTTFGTITYYIDVPAFLYGGGTGTDFLDASGSSANNVLTGGAGTNAEFGGLGRDLLIVGLGASNIHADSADDILSGGWTSYDLSSTAMTYDMKLANLEAIMAEWGSTDSYAARVNYLSLGGGLNGSAVLNGTTVHDNGQVDTLIGATGSIMDWFLAGASDVVKKFHSGEVQTLIS